VVGEGFFVELWVAAALALWALFSVLV